MDTSLPKRRVFLFFSARQEFHGLSSQKIGYIYIFLNRPIHFHMEDEASWLRYPNVDPVDPDLFQIPLCPYNVGPPNVISWFINHSNYSNKYHKP